MLEFKLPSLGADMDEGTLLQWKVQPGDVVKKGDILAIVDTTKAAIEVETWVEGTVHALVTQPGETVPVGAVMAWLLAPGEDAQSASTADRLPATADRLPSTGGARRPASPSARRRASELGVDLAGVRGTGVQGSITLADVDRAARAPSAPASPAAESTIIARDRSAEMRRTIGAAMARAKREIPHYYLADPIPLGQATAWLSTYNAGRSVTDRVLMAALLLKAVARAARTCPDLNGHYVDGRFTAAPAVHVGVAISVRGGGLIAPAIRDVDRLAIDALMRALTDLVARARAGRLRSSELSDATISVTNLGDQGVGEVYGIIYPPQVALVGFGRITEDVVAEGGAIRTMPVVRASLSADHRVSDGHTGALFLARIRTLLQSPAALVEDVS
jgi:pyruvate dehydrogenase E2 component (dihydrolipoamide acetyltransferase)